MSRPAAWDAASRSVEIYLLNKLSEAVEVELRLGEDAQDLPVGLQISSLVASGRVEVAAPVDNATGVVPRISLPALSFSRMVMTMK